MAGKFAEDFLERLRAEVPVSLVVTNSGRVDLRKQGHEYVGLSPFNKENSPSFTINDDKHLWHDFSAGKGGDHFAFLVEVEGRTFPEAVEIVASIGGISLPNGAGPPARPTERRGDDDEVALRARTEGGDRQDGGGRSIKATYDYADMDGTLIYQVCRIEWEDDGKHKKTFIQRRPTPERDGHWIWGLGAGQFLQSRNGDWYQATKDRLAEWKNAPSRTIEQAVEHGLYRLVELKEEGGANDPVFLPEGEKDVETLREWGFCATTNSGGARHWRPEFAEFFRNHDVVIPIDNDEPGRERGDMIAKSLWGIARRIRILDFTSIWSNVPKGGDVTDWRDNAGGNRDLLAIHIGKLPAWAPPERQSKFGLVMWSEQDIPGEEYEYLIEDLVPAAEPMLIIGESQSGKSFFTEDMGMAGATGAEFFGRRVLEPFGVVYCAYEAGKGFKHRMRAHRMHHGLPLDGIPFAVLTKPLNIWSDALNTDQLIEEIMWIAANKFGGIRLGAVVIDTHNRATAGASEIESKDISQIIERYTKIMRATKAGCWIIGHKNAAGRHRGNEQLYNNIETAIDISRSVQIVDKQTLPVKDSKGRWIRTARVLKQREGEEGPIGEFVLGTVEVGTNKYGRPRTSCVVLPVQPDAEESENETKAEAKALNLSDQQSVILQALKDALAENGCAPSPALKLPASIRTVCNVMDWKEHYRRKAADATDAAVNQALKRASDRLLRQRVIGRVNPWVWITGRPVKGVVTGKPEAGSQEPPGRFFDIDDPGPDDKDFR